jgi:CRP-like cAMP-binding protein
MAQTKKRPSDPEAIIDRLNGGRSEAKYQRDQIVYSQGDVADCVSYVQSGKVKVTVVSEEGKEAVVAILLPGSFCGRGMPHRPHAAHIDGQDPDRMSAHPDGQGEHRARAARRS